MATAPPTPPDTDTAAFVAALRRLKAWSGLSYRQLERRATEAGHTLPYSTAATMLGRERLPREQLVVAFVVACGVRDDEAEAWVDARTTIACRHVAAPPAPNTGSKQSWRSRWAFVGAAALVTALLGGAVASGAFTDDQEVHETRTSLRL
ncbi:helix-turn-helix domain-containing protein [Streptomyces sporangiiformans]|uniref:Helix-turn-helix domain-containing protein n=1 Tax=Streptomyces sporangiiformans TaxID=2315329 RepID=A0A505DJB2_9ACTN|nr:helix-turn-helix domain-containing protein [Streptomyces sporangiiformans]TPQ21028.1 helix-turn-helix domain-containing protein [Streptomyces sporangiiformans]